MSDGQLLWLTAASAGLWIAILLMPWQPWRTVERLDPDLAAPSSRDLAGVTAIIPARDEAPVIGTTVRAVREQGSAIQIVVVDDQSTDGTSVIASGAGGDSCTVIRAADLPEQWVGKLWALEQGLVHARTDFVLLIDADIELAPGAVTALLDKADAEGLDLVSLMAVLEMRSFAERMLVPAFVYFFKLLYPFRLSNSRNRLVAAAAGGCVLVKRDMLTRIGGFGSIRGELIDDCALARRVKQAGGRTWIGLTHAVVSRRRMERLADIWRMVARSAYAQLRYSVLLLGFCIAALALAFWTPLAALFAPGPARMIGGVALVVMSATYLPTLRFYRRSLLWAPVLPLTGTLYMLMTLSSALNSWRGIGSTWKGRRYQR